MGSELQDIIGSKILGGKISRRVTGWDLFTTLLGRLNAQGVYRIFLLGSSEEVLKLMTARLSRDYPSIIVAGTMSPPYKPVFSDDDNQHMVKTINAAKPDLLWVAMTAPKQEKWLYENRGALQVPFAGAVGAVFDFYSGTIHRPNRFFQLIGLEWLPRLLQEPKRLRKRMTVSAPRFLFAIFKVWMTKNKFMH